MASSMFRQNTISGDLNSPENVGDLTRMYLQREIQQSSLHHEIEKIDHKQIQCSAC